MVRADRVPFRARNFSPGLADRAVPDVRRNALRGDLVHAARTDRAEVRHDCRAPSCYVPRVCAAARPRMVALFHLAPFQTHPAHSDQQARTTAGGRGVRREFTPSLLLERGGEGSPSSPRRDLWPAQ